MPPPVLSPIPHRLVLILLLSFPLLTRGQTLIGPKVGVTLTKLSVGTKDHMRATDTDVGMMAGVQFETMLGKRGRFGIEFLYARKGGTEHGSDPVLGAYTSQLRLDYVEMPMLARTEVGRLDQVHAVLGAGPFVSYLVNVTEVIGIDGIDLSESMSAGDAGVGAVDIGACLTAGMVIPMPIGRMLIEGRYQWGLMNIDQSGADGLMRNRGFQGGVAYLFGKAGGRTTSQPSRSSPPSPQ